MTFEEIRSLLDVGAGLTIDDKKFTLEQLRILAAHASTGGASLTIHSMTLSVEEMRAIAAEGKGKLSFTPMIS
jgi:hypothetical protein